MEYLDVIENAMVTTSIKPFTNVARASVLFDKILINRIMNNENFIELNQASEISMVTAVDCIGVDNYTGFHLNSQTLGPVYALSLEIKILGFIKCFACCHMSEIAFITIKGCILENITIAIIIVCNYQDSDCDRLIMFAHFHVFLEVGAIIDIKSIYRQEKHFAFLET